jgi:hypothetical protein
MKLVIFAEAASGEDVAVNPAAAIAVAPIPGPVIASRITLGDGGPYCNVRGTVAEVVKKLAAA